MRKTVSVVAPLLVTICMLVALAGCSSGEQSSLADRQIDASSRAAGSSPDANAENVVMGVLSSVSGTSLEIELMDVQGMGGRPQDGEMPDMSDMPEGVQPGSGGGPPQAPDGASFEPPESMPGGASLPEGGFPGGGSGAPPTTGETMSILADDTTEIEIMGGGESISLADLQQGTLLRIELAEDGKTAVRISVMQQPSADTEE